MTDVKKQSLSPITEYEWYSVVSSGILKWTVSDEV